MNEPPVTPVKYPDPRTMLFATKRSLRAPGTFHSHRGEDWEMHYAGSGEVRVRVGKEQLLLRAGDLLTIWPHEPHACLSCRGARYVLNFRGAFLNSLGFPVRRDQSRGLEVLGVRIPAQLCIGPSRRLAVEFLLERLCRESLDAHPTKREMCAAVSAQLILELARSAKEGVPAREQNVSKPARRTIERLCDDVREKPSSRWTTADLVRRSGYGASQLTLLFNSVTGMSPGHWLSHERIRRACRLLVQTDKTVLQIGMDVGFGSRSQFHRAFRKVLGTTPSRFRAMARHDEQA